MGKKGGQGDFRLNGKVIREFRTLQD